jgi:Holliday junction resolvase-like predicted endonuclease
MGRGRVLRNVNFSSGEVDISNIDNRVIVTIKVLRRIDL